MPLGGSKDTISDDLTALTTLWPVAAAKFGSCLFDAKQLEDNKFPEAGDLKCSFDVLGFPKSFANREAWVKHSISHLVDSGPERSNQMSLELAKRTAKNWIRRTKKEVIL